MNAIYFDGEVNPQLPRYNVEVGKTFFSEKFFILSIYVLGILGSLIFRQYRVKTDPCFTDFPATTCFEDFSVNNIVTTNGTFGYQEPSTHFTTAPNVSPLGYTLPIDGFFFFAIQQFVVSHSFVRWLHN